MGRCYSAGIGMTEWEKGKVNIGGFVTVLVPLVLALIGHWYTEALKERDLQGRFVQLAVSMLQDKPQKENTELRRWATEVIDRYSGVPLRKAKEKLIKDVPLRTLKDTHTTLERFPAGTSETRLQKEVDLRKKAGAINAQYKRQSDGAYNLLTTWPVIVEK